MKQLFVITVIFLQANLTLGQENHSVHVILNPTKDSVVLRWAPSSPVAWQLLNKYGYRIERYTIMRDSVILEDKPHVIIHPVPMKPATQSDWVAVIENDDYVAIAAQAIFGETFEMDMKTNDIQQIAQKATELESRFSYALFASDMSPKAASLSALRYVDREVKENESYLYRVYSLVPENVLPIAMGFAYASPSEEVPLPKIQQVDLRPGDRSVMISWNIRELQRVYTGYYIEKSEDFGQTFQRLNKLPYVFVEKGEGVTPYGTFLDSLESNAHVYSYRITGVTPFADLGPPSDAVSCKGVDKTDVTVEKVTGIVGLSGPVKIQWDFPREKEPLIDGFEVERSNKVDEGFRKISQLLPSTVRQYDDVSPSGTNYYRVVSVGKNGNKTSFPILIQKEDSIPPTAPINIRATIDTAGIVKITWDNNSEQDLLGYRIYRSTFKNAEFSQVTVSPITVAAFTDTVNIKTLSKHCFYKVTAVDNRYNTSPYSSVVSLELPDIIPPVPVSFTKAKATQNGIELKWTRCSSLDAASYTVYRRSAYEVDKMLIAGRHIDSTSLTDNPPVETNYTYWVVVEDSSGLKSVPSKPIVIAPLKKPVTTTFREMTGMADREKKQINISWRYPDATQLRSIQIYRYEETESQLSLYKTVPGDAGSFADPNIRINTAYGYRLKAIYRNGKESPFSEEIKINF